MKKILFLSVLCVLLLSGCGDVVALLGLPQPKFQVVVDDGDKFQAKNTTIRTEDNRLTNKVQGTAGEYADNKGLFIDFSKIIYDKNASTNNVFITVTNREDTALFGFYFYKPMQQIIFLIDDKEKIEITLSRSDRDIGRIEYNEYKGAYTPYSEWASGIMKLEDFVKLMNFKTLDVKIIGAERERIIENNIIQPDFKEHLKQFYDELEKFKQY